jgi:hypothetical protein
MYILLRIIVLSIFLLGSSNVVAQTSRNIAAATPSPPACDALHDIYVLLAHANNIRASRPTQTIAPHLNAMRYALTDKPQTVAFTGRDNTLFAAENDEISTYLAQLSESLHPTATMKSKRLIPSLSTPELKLSLSAIATHWKCGAPPAALFLDEIVSNDDPNYTSSRRDTLKGQGRALDRRGDGLAGGDRGVTANSGAMHLSLNSMVLLTGKAQIFVFAVLLTFIGVIRLFILKDRKFKAREARRLLHHSVNVKIGDKEHSMVMVDVSRNGAKLKHETSVGLSNKISIQLGQAWHIAHVKWSNGVFAGIMFKLPLSPDTFRDLTESL